MSSINATTIIENLYWEELIEELYDNLDKEFQQAIDAKIGKYKEASMGEEYDLYDTIDADNLF